MAIYEKYPELDAKPGFNPKVFRQHLDKVILVFGKHMVDEIYTLNKDKVEQVGEAEYKNIAAGLQEKLKAYGPEWFLCSAVGMSRFKGRPGGLGPHLVASTTPAVLAQLLPLPFIVRRVLLPVSGRP